MLGMYCFFILLLQWLLFLQTKYFSDVKKLEFTVHSFATKMFTDLNTTLIVPNLQNMTN